MVSVKLGNKTFENVEAVKLDTPDGSTVEFAPYEEAFAEGKQSEYDRFWDMYLQNGTRKNYTAAFAGEGWTDETFNPKYTPMVAGDGYQSVELMFAYSKITELKEGIVDFSKVIDAYQIFRSCRELLRLPRIDLSSANSSSFFCGLCDKLEEIECIVVSDKLTYSNFFHSGENLREVRFEGVIGNDMSLAWSPLLSEASVQSIIDHLKDLTGVTAKSLTFQANVGAKLTEEQKTAITAKNWTLVY